MNFNNHIFGLLLCIGNVMHSPLFAQEAPTLAVRNQQGKAVPFAAINLLGKDISIQTDINGRLSVSKLLTDTAIITISAANYETRIDTIYASKIEKDYVIVLQESKLSLETVVFTATLERNDKSNSAITFDKKAIEQLQAFSLKDVLNNLPGKAVTAPNMNTVQSISLRGNFGGIYDQNNSQGVAIMIDGMTQSNDANMQSRSLSIRGVGSAGLSMNNGYGVMDVPFQGIDLRDIPTEQIEKIEVIQGVASARYGELTDGAILIERQAGVTPLILSANLLNGSIATAVSKGFKLSDQLGVMNLGFNFTNSNADPRDKVKTYNRFTLNMMWTKSFGNRIKTH